MHDADLPRNYWEQRQRDPKVFCLIICWLDAYYFILELGRDDLNVGIVKVELAVVLAAIALLSLSCWDRKFAPLVRYGFMLSLLQTVLFMFNLPGRRAYMTDNSWHVTSQFMLCFSIIGLFFHFYSFPHE